MNRWQITALIVAALYVLMIFVRLWLNQLTHLGANGDLAAFQAAVRWYTIRDIGVLTGIYGLFLVILLGRRPKN